MPPLINTTLKPLELDGELQLELNGESMVLAAQGNGAHLTIPSLVSGLRIYRSLPCGKRGAVNRALKSLSAVGLTVGIRVGHRTVITVGGDQKPSRILRALRLPPVSMHWTAVLRSLLPGD